MAAKIFKLAGELLKNKGLMKGIRNEALVSGALNTGVNFATGADPLTALAYGVSDAVLSGGLQGAARGIRGKPSGFELPANITGSILSGVPVAALDPRMRGQASAPMVRQETTGQMDQIDQQNMQRMLINQDLLAGQYMPGTMFQQMGVNNPRATLQQYMNDQGPQVNMAAMERDMARIVGL